MCDLHQHFVIFRSHENGCTCQFNSQGHDRDPVCASLTIATAARIRLAMHLIIPENGEKGIYSEFESPMGTLAMIIAMIARKTLT